jgi:hypothetical protein
MSAAAGSKSSLVRDVVLVVSVKLIVLTLIYALFFAPSGRAPTDPSARLLGPARQASKTR